MSSPVTNNTAKVEPREGIVTVYDHNGVYVGRKVGAWIIAPGDEPKVEPTRRYFAELRASLKNALDIVNDLERAGAESRPASSVAPDGPSPDDPTGETGVVSRRVIAPSPIPSRSKPGTGDAE